MCFVNLESNFLTVQSTAKYHYTRFFILSLMFSFDLTKSTLIWACGSVSFFLLTSCWPICGVKFFSFHCKLFEFPIARMILKSGLGLVYFSVNAHIKPLSVISCIKEHVVKQDSFCK